MGEALVFIPFLLLPLHPDHLLNIDTKGSMKFLVTKLLT